LAESSLSIIILKTMNHSANAYYLMALSVLGCLRVIHGLNDNHRQTRSEDHEVLGVGRVIHGLKVNYRQIRL
jgi:hypothetical protein